MQLKHVTCDCCNGTGFLRMPHQKTPCVFCFTLGFKSFYVSKRDA